MLYLQQLEMKFSTETVHCQRNLKTGNNIKERHTADSGIAEAQRHNSTNS